MLQDTWTIFGRCLRQTLRNKVAVVFGAVQPLLYLVLFGPLLTKVAGTRGFGGDAWQVFVPGLLIQLGLFGAGFAGFSIIGELRSGVIERMRVTPVSRTALLLGRVLRDAVVVLVQSVLLLVAAVACGLRAPVAGVLIGLGFVVLLAVGVAALSYALALTARTEDTFAPMITTVAVPLMLLSGIVLPMALAPRWLDVLSRCTPFRYFVEAIRAAFLGRYTSGAVLLGALVAAGLLVFSLVYGTHRFRGEHA